MTATPDTALSQLSDSAFAAELAQRAGLLLLELRSGKAFEDSGPEGEALQGAASEGDALEGKALGKAGDARSNALLLQLLAAGRPGDAVLSEESVDTAERLTADRVWIIDPLDGTREYGMPGRSDWAVHVALWERDGEDGAITAAAVAQPSLNSVYMTGATQAQVGDRAVPRFLVSDSRPPAFANAVARALAGELSPMGSAGAKAMAVVRGDAEAYLHAGGQWEWDSAAPVGVALAAGLHASRVDGSPLTYNAAHPYLPDLLICRADLAQALLEAIAAAG